MLSEFEYSTRLADLMPRKLVNFLGLEQSQGDWQWCIDFNRRQMPSLQPKPQELLQLPNRPDNHSFRKSWNAFKKIQRYTDGEAFFLCYPAAFQFGIYGMTGKYDHLSVPSWKNAYLNDQKVTDQGGESEKLRYSSSVFDRQIRSKFRVVDNIARNSQEIFNQQGPYLNVVQVSCNYPMFGNKRFGHFISIVKSEDTDNSVLIAGGLAPFGIYETPFAAVDRDELHKFINDSNRLMAETRQTSSIDIRDRSNNPGIAYVTVDLSNPK